MFLNSIKCSNEIISIISNILDSRAPSISRLEMEGALALWERGRRAVARVSEPLSAELAPDFETAVRTDRCFRYRSGVQDGWGD